MTRESNRHQTDDKPDNTPERESNRPHAHEQAAGTDTARKSNRGQNARNVRVSSSLRQSNRPIPEHQPPQAASTSRPPVKRWEHR